MLTLSADNRNLLESAKFSYLNANYASGQSSLVLSDSTDFSSNDFILIGEIGSTSAEILRVSSKADATNTLTLATSTKHAHAESTKVTIIKYDQVRFFHTTTTTFSASDPVRSYVQIGDETTQFDITNTAGSTFRYTYDTTGTNPNISKYVRVGYTISIQASAFNAGNKGTFTVTAVDTNYFEVTNASGVVESNKVIGTGYIKVLTNYLDIDPGFYQTTVADSTNTTGYGWFVFYNSYTATASTNSNAIPYAGFAENSVKSILDSFLSLLNNTEQKLISMADAFSWLNEAYSRARNELNLINNEFNATDDYDVTVTSGIQEYSLPDDFSDMIGVYDENSETPIGEIAYNDAKNNDFASSNTTKWYLRGSYLGFSPSPTEDKTYTIRYKTKTTQLTSYYDSVDMPDNQFYMIKDYMIYRASPKIGRGDGMADLAKFTEAIQNMKITAISRGGTPESFGKSDSVLI